LKLRAAGWFVLAAAGCSSILPTAPPQAYYDLAYDPAPVQCARSYSSPVEVWDFSAVAPFDRAEMVVTQGREVSFSRGHQWVDRPDVMVAGKLIRDLGAGRLFPLAVSPRDPEGAPLEITGNLYRFAWEKDGGSARARFEADVILRKSGEPAQILLHRRYQVDSDALPATTDAAVFARAMSGVVGRFSALLRRDLCDALPAGK
jgi:ABC-type uncharacterized transport system auxiliary subunit